MPYPKKSPSEGVGVLLSVGLLLPYAGLRGLCLSRCTDANRVLPHRSREGEGHSPKAITGKAAWFPW